MKDTAILYPMLAQVLLTLFLFGCLGYRRYVSATRGDVRLSEIALDDRMWPEDVRKVANSLLNQFQLPVLFYLICLVLFLTSAVDIVHVVLAWIFTLSRLVHSFIHTGSNFVPNRFYAFLVGFFSVLVMWGYFTVSLISKSF